jgi:uncharacterized membrane protein HdeD (DUF308 family)
MSAPAAARSLSPVAGRKHSRRPARQEGVFMSYAPRERPGTGWLLFSAIVLITAGIMRIFDALWAFDKDDEVGEGLQVLLFDDNLAAYGWLWLLVGVLLIAAGFGVMNGSEWARWFGIAVAAFGAITSFLWIYEFPIWALVGTILSLLVIYGLASYGGTTVDDGV